MALFRLLWLFDTAIALVALSCFIIYLFKGPVSNLITGTWWMVMGAMTLTLLAAGGLKMTSHPAFALMLLLLMASLGIVYLVLMLSHQAGKVKTCFHAR